MVRRKIKKKRFGDIAAPWLGMIATVDHNAWVAIFRHDFGYNERPLPPSFKKGGSPPEFWLSFTNQEIPSQAEDILEDDTPCYRHFFSSRSTESGYARSEKLLRAREEIWRNITPAMRYQLIRAKPLAIDAKFRGPQQQNDAFAQTYLENVRDIVRVEMSLSSFVSTEDMAADTAQGLRAGFPFAFQNIELDLSEASLLPPPTLPILTKLGASGVQLGPAVGFGRTAAYGRFSVAELGPLLLALTNSSVVGGSHDVQQGRT
ncbi:hypothetical protein FI667_g6014, partial [Globisporangium splendens]